MKKRFLSFCLILSLSLSLALPVFAAPPAVDPDNVFASYTPELANLSEDEIAKMTNEEINAIFEEVFSISSSNFSNDYTRSCIENLSSFYRYRSSNDSAPKSRAATSSSTNDSHTYTGTVGTFFERDYDLSPLTLNEVSSNWWTVGVGYITYDHALCLAARLDENMWNSVQDYADGAITNAVLSSALKTFFGLSSFTLTISSAALALSIKVLDDEIDRADYRALQSATLSGARDDLTRVMYEWTGSNIHKTYKSVSVDTTYSSTNKRYTYKDVPNPTGLYGIWTDDEIGPF